MQQFNYPTTILNGEGSLEAFAERLRGKARRVLLVTDATLAKAGLAADVASVLEKAGIGAAVFDGVHPNPVEEDVEKGVEAYRREGCDALVALGGGSPLDAAKVIRFMAVHPGPLSRYDATKGGDALIVHPLPPLYGIPTTAGTGSEVGRSSVIILRGSARKTFFFHPRLLPDIAVLEPRLTAGLPAPITAATGIDAFTHCLEAFLVPEFHPLADGIALEGIRLILRNLPVAYADGRDLKARNAMQVAAVMGATAFQKGLGMVHSLAHPLSARYNTHHGLANALLLPDALAFLERAAAEGGSAPASPASAPASPASAPASPASAPARAEARAKLARVQAEFREAGLGRDSLSGSCRAFFQSLQVPFGLRHHKVPEADLDSLSRDAMEDISHLTNALPVQREDMLAVYRAAY